MVNRFCDPTDYFQCLSIPYPTEVSIVGPQFDIVGPQFDPPRGSDSIMGLLYQKDVSGDWIEYRFAEVLDDPDGMPLTYENGFESGIAYSEQNIDIPVIPTDSVGPQGGLSAHSDSSDGGTAWSTPLEILTSDDVYSTCVLAPNTQSEFLVVDTFGFSIPAGAFVLTIIVEIEIKSSGTDTTLTDVLLVDGDNVLTTDVALATSETVLSYDKTPTAWGVPATGAFVSTPTFGVKLRCANTSASPRTISVDYISVYVFYAEELASECVVRLREGRGDYWLMDYEPRIEIVKIDVDADIVDIGGVLYQHGWLMSYSQDSKILEIKEDILIRGLTS